MRESCFYGATNALLRLDEKWTRGWLILALLIDGQARCGVSLCDIASIDRHRFGLGLHLLGDAEAVKYVEHKNAAFGSLVADERLDRQQRSLERIGRGDIVLGRSRPHREANAGTRNVDATCELALFDEIIAGACSEDRHIHRLAALDAINNEARWKMNEHYLVRHLAFEPSGEIDDRGAHRRRAHDLDFGGHGRVRQDRDASHHCERESPELREHSDSP